MGHRLSRARWHQVQRGRRGACWLSVEGVAQAIRLERGDCFLLSRRRTFSLRSDPGLPAVPADQVYRHAVQGIARCGTADGFFLIGGRFAFGEAAGLLVDGLPPVAVVRADRSRRRC